MNAVLTIDSGVQNIVETELLDDGAILINNCDIVVITSPVETGKVRQLCKRTHDLPPCIGCWMNDPVMR